MTIEQESQDIIEKYLKSQGIKYLLNIDSVNDTDPYYDIFVGSEESHIQLEFSSKDKEDEELCAQFWVGEPDCSVYHESSYHIKTQDDLEGCIEELLNAAKSYIRLKSKIEALLDKIKEEIQNSGFGNLEFDLTVDDVLNGSID